MRAKLNGETAKVSWAEMQRHLARGVVIGVAGELDLIGVAVAMAQDDGAAIGRWMQAGQVGKLRDEQARDWLARDPDLWSVVVAPSSRPGDRAHRQGRGTGLTGPVRPRFAHMSRASLFSAVLAGLLLVSALSANAEWFTREEAVMGTAVRVELWHEDAAAAQAAMAAVMDEMHRIDERMSPYKPASELSRINREAARAPVPISQEMFDLIARSVEFSKLSGGAFDITFSSVGYLYDYRQHIHPSEEEIARALPGIHYRHLQLDPKRRTIRFARDGWSWPSSPV